MTSGTALVDYCLVQVVFFMLWVIGICYSFSLGNCPRQVKCTIIAHCLQIYRASAGNVRRSKEETEADVEEEDEFGYTTSEYGCYFTQTVFGNVSCFFCVMFGPFACNRLLFSCFCCV